MKTQRAYGLGFIVLLISLAGLTGCDRGERGSRGEASGQEDAPSTVFVVKNAAGAQAEILADPENPIPALLQLSDAVDRLMVPHSFGDDPSEATPVIIGSVDMAMTFRPEQIEFHTGQDGTVHQGTGTDSMVRMELTMTYTKPIQLVQFGPGRFWWCRVDEGETPSVGDKPHEGLYPSPASASEWLAIEYADMCALDSIGPFDPDHTESQRVHAAKTRWGPMWSQMIRDHVIRSTD